MPLNAHPPTIDGAAFDAKVEAATAASVVDFALWGGLVPGNLDRLGELAERGVAGFKAFMCDSGIEDFPAVDDEVLEAGMARAAALGLPVLVHAERPSALRDPQGTGWRDFVASRPIRAELEAIEVAIELAERTGCDLHVVHVSSAEGVALVAASNATCETCPHYLTLTEDDLETLGTRAKCAPPLRPAHEVEALWRALNDVAFVASDHSPCPPEMKEGDFTAAWGGIAGAQTMLSLLLERLPPQTVAALTSANPGQALQPPQGPARAGRRRRPRARGPRGPPAARAGGPPPAQPLRGATAPAHRPHPRTRRRLEGPPDHATKGPRMSDLRITAGPLQFGADWVEAAPKTCAAFKALLPFRNKIIHVRWSGESAWIPLGDMETNLDFENHTSHPAPGRDPALPRRLQRDRDPLPVRRHVLREHRRPARRQPFPDRHGGRRPAARARPPRVVGRCAGRGVTPRHEPSTSTASSRSCARSTSSSSRWSSCRIETAERYLPTCGCALRSTVRLRRHYAAAQLEGEVH